MKLYYVPWPWDYHQLAGIVIMATTKGAAVKKAMRYYHDLANLYIDGEDTPEYWRMAPLYDKVVEIASGIYCDNGCNC